jgi:hypothetical protein
MTARSGEIRKGQLGGIAAPSLLLMPTKKSTGLRSSGWFSKSSFSKSSGLVR